MKLLELLLWVTQFGLSVFLPPCFFLLVSSWLQERYDLGLWCPLLLGALGLLISISTAKANWKAMKKAADRDRKEPPVSFNDHR